MQWNTAVRCSGCTPVHSGKLSYLADERGIWHSISEPRTDEPRTDVCGGSSNSSNRGNASQGNNKAIDKAYDAPQLSSDRETAPPPPPETKVTSSPLENSEVITSSVNLTNTTQNSRKMCIQHALVTKNSFHGSVRWRVAARSLGLA